MHRISIALACLLATCAAPALSQGKYATRPAPAPQAPPRPGTPEAAAAAAQVRPSSGALKPIVALQKAYKSKDPAAIASALAAANAAATTKEDRYIIGQLQLTAAIEANDHAATGAAINLIAGSGYLPPAEVANLYIAHGNGFSERKQHAEAAAAFERGLAVDPSNLALLGNLAEAKYAQGRAAEAVPYLQRLITATAATGAKPSENIYKRAVSIANDAKLPVAVDLARAWVTAYPSGESWRNAIGLYQNVNKPDVATTLDLLRLMRAAGAMSSPTHYSLYSTVAADRGIYAEAEAVIEEGLAKNAFTASSPVIKDVIAGLKGKSKPTAADLETASRDAKTGTALLRVGDRYYGAGNYAKAAELYRLAKGKPGVDQGLVDLHLGMALARSGDKAGAAAALGQVGGAHAPVAQYWLIYVNQMA